MKLVIDELISSTGWTTSDSAKISIETANAIPEFIANDNSASLLFHIKASSDTAYVQKTFTAIDVTDYNYIVISIHSAWKKDRGGKYNDIDSFLYQIDFNATMSDFMVPVYSSLTSITFDITDITSIDRIRITSNTDLEDYIVVSHCVAVTDQLPLDIWSSLKATFEDERTALDLNRKYKVGTITGTTGDTTMYIDADGAYARDWLEKYSVVEIEGEVHQLMDNNEIEFEIGEMYDGKSLLNDYADADVYLYFPVEFGLYETEILLPGIAISGMAPTPVERGSKVEEVLDSFREDMTVKTRQGFQVFRYDIQVDCEARNDQLLADTSLLVRRVISRNYLWINGRKYQMVFQTDPVYIEAVDSFNQIPKLQFTVGIEVREERYDRTELANATTITTTITPKSQGDI